MDPNLGDIEIDGFVDAGQDGLEPRPHLLVGASDLSNLLENDAVLLPGNKKRIRLALLMVQHLHLTGYLSLQNKEKKIFFANRETTLD